MKLSVVWKHNLIANVLTELYLHGPGETSQKRGNTHNGQSAPHNHTLSSWANWALKLLRQTKKSLALPRYLRGWREKNEICLGENEGIVWYVAGGEENKKSHAKIDNMNHL